LCILLHNFKPQCVYKTVKSKRKSNHTKYWQGYEETRTLHHTSLMGMYVTTTLKQFGSFLKS
jgi:hypothetical protein